MTRTALDIATAHLDRIAQAKAASRAKLEIEAPDLLRFAEEVREVFGAGVRITRLKTNGE